jgi:predicted metal-dependent phosphoesterase TrpH
MGKADLHIHTLYSYDGFCAVSTMLEQAAQIAKLDVIAITDHDEIDGALEAEILGPKFGIRVIPGCEISPRPRSGWPVAGRDRAAGIRIGRPVCGRAS